MRSFLLVLLIFATGSCWAHQQKEAYSLLIFNTRTAQLEIQHKFFIHDVEHAAQQLVSKDSDLLGDPASREAFARYLLDHFGLQDQNGQLLPLSYVGSEVEGKYLWVYQETPITAAMSALSVKMSGLQDLWPTQINLVNIERNKKVRSVRLTNDSGWQKIQLEP